MIVIEFSKTGEAISDFEYKNFVNLVKKAIEYSDYEYFNVSTSIPINAIRAAICKNEIDYKDITLRFNGKDFQTNEYGRIDEWPNGFCDAEQIVIEDLLYYAMNKSRKLREQRNEEIKES